jgi:hypothetical protein
LSVNGWDEATSMADVLRTMDTLWVFAYIFTHM